MKISVIIPTYKPKEYIWECLHSLCVQTFSKDDFEVIIVLNGCDKPWKEDIERYIDGNMCGLNVRLIQTDQGGVSNARNVGLDNARGEFISFIDDDDYVSSTYLNSLYQNAAGDGTVVLSNAVAFNDDLPDMLVPYPISDVYKQHSGRKKINLLSKVRKYFSGPCMKLIPKSVIQNRRFDVRFKNGEDSLFMFLISDKIDTIKFSDSTAVYYRRNRQNSAVTSYRSFGEVLKNTMRLIGCYSKIFWFSPLKYNFCFYLTRVFAAFKTLINKLFC